MQFQIGRTWRNTPVVFLLGKAVLWGYLGPSRRSTQRPLELGIGTRKLSGGWIAQWTMNRVEIHDVPKQEVVAHLTGLAHRVEPAPPQARFDFLVDDHIRLALRVAYPSSSRRRVHVGGRHYNYVYRAWNFNFHHRGKVGERYSDFFACVPLVPGQHLDLAQAFVIPWEAISGKTFYLPDSRRSYAGKFATYRNAWAQIARGEAGQPASA
jgi:hypothetical protein